VEQPLSYMSLSGCFYFGWIPRVSGNGWTNEARRLAFRRRAPEEYRWRTLPFFLRSPILRTVGHPSRLLLYLYDWLACADSARDADLIFAIAGRQSRKIHALDLFSRGRAPRLLLSVDRFEIRRFSSLPLPSPIHLDLVQSVASVSPRQRHLFVSFADAKAEVTLVRPGRLGTLSEIHALAAWLKAHPEVGSLLIVSSGPHLRRIRMCCRYLLPKSLALCLTASENDDCLRRETWWCDPKARVIVLLEFPKLLLYWPLLQLQRMAGVRFVLARWRATQE